MTFDNLNLASAILKAVSEIGYDKPTPIQAQAIPAVLAGKDLLAGAQTGTGKTAAFTLPMLHLLSESNPERSDNKNKSIRALVLTPTRELAAQVEESVREYGKYLSLVSAVIFGGVGMNAQINQLKRGVDILVATPGRLLDLQQQGFVDLSSVEILVLDEADRMLDMGFIHDVKKILALLPKQKQSLLFSATFNDEIRDLASNLLNKPESIQVTPSNTTAQLISQLIYPVGRNKKKQLLEHLIKENNWTQVLIFTRTKFGANNVADFLTEKGIKAMALHGNKSQSARTQALQGFKSGEMRALVATDIAARGIDIDDLTYVVNYDIPNVSEDYVHRIGRTGRAGASGKAVSLVCLDEEGFMMDIERFTKQTIPVEIINGFEADHDEQAQPIAMGRQTIWGGAGKPPSREVMAAAAKTARSEMLERIRQNRAQQGSPNSRNQRPNSRFNSEQNQEDTLARKTSKPRRNTTNEKTTRTFSNENRSPRAAHSLRDENANPRSSYPKKENADSVNHFAPSNNAHHKNTKNNKNDSFNRTNDADSNQRNTPRTSRGPGVRVGGVRAGNANNNSNNANSQAGVRHDTSSAIANLTKRPTAAPRAQTSRQQPDPMRTSVDSMLERGHRPRSNFGGNGNNRFADFGVARNNNGRRNSR